MSKKTNWKTILPAISIPWNEDGSLNEKEYRQYLRWLTSFEEIGGIVVNGHTGEITSLPSDMRAKLTEIAVDEVGDKILVVSGVSADSTEVAIEEALKAKDAGADGIMLMPPHIWLRFSMKQESAYQFYKDVAEGSGMNIIVHLYPATTKAFIEVDTLIKMCHDIPNIKAIKQGTRVMPIYEHDIRKLRKECPDIALYTCYDEALAISLEPGMDGAILGFAGCVPELIIGVIEAFKNNDLKTAREYADKIFPISRAIYGSGQPSGEAHARLKQALVERGIFSNGLMKKPVIGLSDKEKEIIKSGVKESGVDTDIQLP